LGGFGEFAKGKEYEKTKERVKRADRSGEEGGEKKQGGGERSALDPKTKKKLAISERGEQQNIF